MVESCALARLSVNGGRDLIAPGVSAFCIFFAKSPIQMHSLITARRGKNLIAAAPSVFNGLESRPEHATNAVISITTYSLHTARIITLYISAIKLTHAHDSMARLMRSAPLSSFLTMEVATACDSGANSYEYF